MEVPHIRDDLIEWTIPLDPKFKPDEFYKIASHLLRCRDISLNHVQTKSHVTLLMNEDDNFGNQINLKSSITNPDSTFQLVKAAVISSWSKLYQLLPNWIYPPVALINFARLKETGCPWQVGYLSTPDIQGHAMCLIATHCLELFILPPSLQTRIQTVRDDKHRTQDLSLLELSQCSTTEISSLHDTKDSRFLTHMKPNTNRAFKWNLSYIDPWPRWRLASFLNTSELTHIPKTSCRSLQLESSSASALLNDKLTYLVAIGYSNGSVEIIDLSINEDEKPEPGSSVPIRRSRILIPSPYLNPILSMDDRYKVLFPIVALHFLDECHLLVCHFRGHFDLWHLDWTAKRYPTRLMTRLYPTHRRFGVKQTDCWLNNSRKSSPLLGASYDVASSLLVLSHLPDFQTPTRTNLMHEKLELSCYHLSKSSPYLTPASPLLYLSPSMLNFNLVQVLQFGKHFIMDTMLASLLRGRNQSQSDAFSKDSLDAIAYITVCPLRDNSSNLDPSTKLPALLIACLHCSGSYSIWLGPSLDLLSIIANRQDLGSNLPYRLTWWSKPFDETTKHNCHTELHLSVICENGLMDLLKFNPMSGSESAYHEALQLSNLNLAPLSHFACLSNQLSVWYSNDSNHLVNSATEIVIVQTRLKDLNKFVSSASQQQQQQQQYLVRCTRLKFTTPLGLFNHLIYAGKFDEAIRFTRTGNFDVELVHQQRWLKLCSEPGQLIQFDRLIDSTLGMIRDRPLWVIKQCLEFNPSYASTTLINYAHVLNAYRLLTHHGLKVFDRFSNANESTRDVHEFIRQRLQNQLVHIDWVEKLIQMEMSHDMVNQPCQRVLFGPESEKPCLQSVVQCLNNFRYFSLLDIAYDYGQSKCFIALNLLLCLFPQSVGIYRLALGSSLNETLPPEQYANWILKPLGLPSMELAGQYKPQLEPDPKLLNLLKANLIHPNQLICQNLIQNDLNLYLNCLCSWLVQRARQIESRSGLTSHGLQLLHQGIQICNFLIRDEMVQSVREDTRLELGRLHKAYEEFVQVAQIVYHKSGNPNTVFRIGVVNPPESDTKSKHQPFHSEEIALARFNSADYRRLNALTLLDLFIQLCYPKSDQNCQPTPTRNHVIMFVLGIALPCMVCKYDAKDHANRELFLARCFGRLSSMFGFGDLKHLLDLIQRSALGEFVRSNQQDYRLAHFGVKDDGELEADLNVLSVDLVMRSLLKVLLDTDSFIASDSDSKSNSLSTTFLNESRSLVNLMIHCSKSDRLSKQLELVIRLIQALEELGPLVKLIENEVGSSIPTTFLSIGALYRCRQRGDHLQQLLNSWMSLLNRLVSVLRREAKAKSERDDKWDDLGAYVLPKLNSVVPQLYKILAKTYEGYPAQAWLHTGLQYALFASGDEDLLELSGKLYFSQPSSGHLDLFKPPTLSPETQLTWGCCLLQATRTYVDTSLPKRSHLKLLLNPPVKSTDNLGDPNERLARQCIRIGSLLFANSKFAQLQAAFEVEKHILNAACFVSTIGVLLPNPKSLTAQALPYKLRKLWTSAPAHVQYRQSFVEDLFSEFILSHSPEASSLIKLALSDQCLNQIASDFQLSLNQTQRCFLRAFYKVCQSDHCSMGHLLDISHLCRQFLDTLINTTDKSGWFETASWAGYDPQVEISSEPHTADSSQSLGPIVPWTSLHLLFNLAKPSSTLVDPKNSLTDLDADLFLLWVVERYRLRLVRFSLAYCPAVEHLGDLSRTLALCLAKLECLSVPLASQQSIKSGFELRHFFKQFIGSTDQADAPNSFDLGTTPIKPGFYSLGADSGGEEEHEITEQLSPLERIPYNFSERQLWLCFLWTLAKSNHLNRLKLDLIPTLASCCANASRRDTRLALSYATLGPKFPGSNTVSDLALKFSESLKSEFAFSSGDITFSQRVQFVLLCHALMSSTLLKSKPHTCHSHGCFPQGSDLLPTWEIFNSLSHNLQNLMSTLCRNALSMSLVEQMHSVSSSIDLNRFYADPDYQKCTIYGLSTSHLGLALRLCRLHNLPQDEALFSRFEYLLLEPGPGVDAHQELDNIIRWMSKFDSCYENLVRRCTTSLYPFLTSLESTKSLFQVLPPETVHLLVGQLPVSIHKSVLSILAKDIPNSTKLIQSLTYKKFIDSLYQTNFMTSDQPYKSHPLYGLVDTKRSASTLAKLISLIVSSDSPEPCLTGADVFALYGMHALRDSTSLESFKSSSGILTLLSNIGPQTDPNSPRRLIKWIDELVFVRTQCQLTVDHRRWILNKVLTYLTRPADSKETFNSTQPVSHPCSSDPEWKQAVRTIQSYLNHFERVDQLTRDFESFLTPNVSSTGDDLGDFHQSLFGTKPNDQMQAVQVLEDLTSRIVEQNLMGHEPIEDNVVRILNQLNHMVPLCLEALDFDVQAAMQVIANSIALTLTCLPTQIQMTRQTLINKETNGASPNVSSTTDLVQPALLNYIHTCLSIQRLSSPIQADQFGGLLLSRRPIRQRFGRQLVDYLESWAQDRSVQFEHRVLAHSLNDLALIPDQQSALRKTLDEIVRQLQVDSVDAKQAASCLFQSVIDPSDGLCEDLLEFERSVIELIEVILTDNSSDDGSALKNLWAQWIDHFLNSKLVRSSTDEENPVEVYRFFVSESYRFSVPSVSLVRAIQSALLGCQARLAVQTTLFTSCLIHPDPNLIPDTLKLLDSNPNLTDWILHPLDALQFVWVHPEPWIHLAQDKDASGSRSRLFARLLDYLADQLPQTSNGDLLGRYCIRLLKLANLWPEAIYLCQAIQRPTRYLLPLDYVVNFIHNINS